MCTFVLGLRWCDIGVSQPNNKKTDKTFRIAKPMRKVSWTKRFAAGGGSVGGGLEWRDGKDGRGEWGGGVEKEIPRDVRSIKKAASSFVAERG